VFQSTHPRGVRPPAASTSSRRTCFNPRTREGCDHRTHKDLSAAVVSIHAPARGATDVGHGALPAYHVSIHAPARGATRHGNVHVHYEGMFQSTHPRGVRRASSRQGESSHSRFNPRTREGCDGQTRSMRSTHNRFNPRTREGCDACSLPCMPPGASFNPRTREGCDCIPYQSIRHKEVSIHAPARGATARRRSSRP